MRPWAIVCDPALACSCGMQSEESHTFHRLNIGHALGGQNNIYIMRTFGRDMAGYPQPLPTPPLPIGNDILRPLMLKLRFDISRKSGVSAVVRYVCTKIWW